MRKRSILRKKIQRRFRSIRKGRSFPEGTFFDEMLLRWARDCYYPPLYIFNPHNSYAEGTQFEIEIFQNHFAEIERRVMMSLLSRFSQKNFSISRFTWMPKRFANERQRLIKLLNEEKRMKRVAKTLLGEEFVDYTIIVGQPTITPHDGRFITQCSTHPEGNAGYCSPKRE